MDRVHAPADLSIADATATTEVIAYTVPAGRSDRYAATLLISGASDGAVLTVGVTVARGGTGYPRPDLTETVAGTTHAVPLSPVQLAPGDALTVTLTSDAADALTVVREVWGVDGDGGVTVAGYADRQDPLTAARRAFADLIYPDAARRAVDAGQAVDDSAGATGIGEPGVDGDRVALFNLSDNDAVVRGSVLVKWSGPGGGSPEAEHMLILNDPRDLNADALNECEVVRGWAYLPTGTGVTGPSDLRHGDQMRVIAPLAGLPAVEAALDAATKADAARAAADAALARANAIPAYGEPRRVTLNGSGQTRDETVAVRPDAPAPPDRSPTHGAAELAVGPLASAVPVADAAAARPLFSAIDHGASAYTDNPGFWLAGVRPVACAVHDGGRPAAAISDRMIVTCGHGGDPDGDAYRWVAADGTVIDRMVTATALAPGYATIGPADLRLGLLDSPLPASVPPLPLLPADWRDRVADLGEGLPAVVVDAQPHAWLGRVRRLGSGAGLPAATVDVDRWPAAGGAADGDDARHALWEEAAGGDSGSPVVLPLDDGGGVSWVYLGPLLSTAETAAPAADLGDWIDATAAGWGVTAPARAGLPAGDPPASHLRDDPAAAVLTRASGAAVAALNDLSADDVRDAIPGLILRKPAGQTTYEVFASPLPAPGETRPAEDAAGNPVTDPATFFAVGEAP